MMRKLFSIIVSLFLPTLTQAAILYSEPVSGEYRAGDSFIVSVRINPEEECINAVQADLNFSKDILEAVDFSQGNSILSFWVKNPEIDNNSGAISFAGGIPSGFCGILPGDPGESNLLGKIIFSVKPGFAENKNGEVKFLETSQVLLNDGLGTPAKLSTKGSFFEIRPSDETQSKNEWQAELAKDKLPPEPFQIEISRSPDIFKDKYFITFQAVDKQSGIDHYEVQEGQGDWQETQSPYLLTDQKLRSIIRVGAADKAGNERIIEYSPIPVEEPFAWPTVISVLIAGAAAYFIFKMRRQKTKTILLFCVLFSAFFFLAGSASAASLFLAPSLGSYSAGSSFTVSVKVNTEGKAANTAEATLSFNPTKLSVVGISKANSVFSLWVSEPSFSNEDGIITFAGGKPSPGFSGASGSIITITFKGLSAGTASVNFASASVLADDGLGTNILSTLISGSYTITERQIIQTQPSVTPSVPSIPVAGVPAAPAIESDTHSEENQWYANNDPKFSWEIPSDVSAVRLLVDKNSNSVPTVTYEPAVSEKQLEDLSDGTNYLHARFKNSYGWGEIVHRKILIDTEAPASFELAIIHGDDKTDPTPVLKFGTSDSLSGIDYYQVTFQNENGEISRKEASSPHKSSPLVPGKYEVIVEAFDKAGNSSAARGELEIASIEMPEITGVPISVNSGENLEIAGIAKPGLKVRLYIQREGGEPIFETVKTDESGNFALIYEKTLVKGNYVVWARAEDQRGALSNPTEKYPVEVGLPSFLKIGKIAIDYLTTMATLIILIVGIIAVLFYSWYRVSIWRKRVRKETGEVKENIDKAFKALREEVEEQIELLDGKPGLNKDERKVREKLKEALNVSEEFIGKEVKDVEKELE